MNLTWSSQPFTAHIPILVVIILIIVNLMMGASSFVLRMSQEKEYPLLSLWPIFKLPCESAVKIYEHLDDLVRHINTTLVGITKSERIVTFFYIKI